MLNDGPTSGPGGPGPGGRPGPGPGGRPGPGPGSSRNNSGPGPGGGNTFVYIGTGPGSGTSQKTTMKDSLNEQKAQQLEVEQRQQLLANGAKPEDVAIMSRKAIQDEYDKMKKGQSNVSHEPYNGPQV